MGVTLDGGHLIPTTMYACTHTLGEAKWPEYVEHQETTSTSKTNQQKTFMVRFVMLCTRSSVSNINIFKDTDEKQRKQIFNLLSERWRPHGTTGSSFWSGKRRRKKKNIKDIVICIIC